MSSEFDIAWGTHLLRVMRITALCSIAIALVEYIGLKALERQDSCLAYVELMPLLTISIGVTIAGATAVLAAFAARLEPFISTRLRHSYRVLFLAIFPLAFGLLYLFSEYAPLVEAYVTNPDVFCD